MPRSLAQFRLVRRILAVVLCLGLEVGGVHGQGAGPASVEVVQNRAKYHTARTVVPPAHVATQASAHFDATYYHLQLDLDLPEGRIAPGRVRVEGLARGMPLDTLRLDFTDSLTVTAVRTPDGTPLSFSHADYVLAVALPETAGPGSRVAVDILYEGVPRDAGFGAYTVDRINTGSADEPIVWTLSEPYFAREWWPCKDHPSDKADSVRVTVTVPEGLRVGSNGLLEREQTEAGRSTFSWFERYPITTYLVSIAVGPYAVFEQTYVRPDSLAARHGPLELPILHYKYAHERQAVLPGGWSEVVEMLPVFEYWFGPYPFPLEKYGHAEFGWGGGMEHQTMSSMGGFNTSLVAHELAHMWFGDLITMASWPHLWLNEGFASYSELLYFDARPERYPGTFETALENDQALAQLAQGTLIVSDTAQVSNLFSGVRVYAKGSVVLHMLRYVIGDAAFREVLNAYTASPELAYGNATTDDFQRIAEAVSGQDLDSFFRQWVTQGTGYPSYEVEWSGVPVESGYTVRVTLRQTQEAPRSNTAVFEMPVTFAVRSAGRADLFRVSNTAREQTYFFSVPDLPTAVLFDPEGALLRDFIVPTVVAVEDAAPADVRPALTAVYPNPVSVRLHVRYVAHAESMTRLALYDVLGRRVLEAEAGGQGAGPQTATLDVTALADGVYVLRLETDAGPVAARRVVVGR